MIKTAAIALVCGFIGAALYGRFFPAQSPYDYIAVANYTDSEGKMLPSAQIELVARRAEQMQKAGFIIFNGSAMHSYPAELAIPHNLVSRDK